VLVSLACVLLLPVRAPLKKTANTIAVKRVPAVTLMAKGAVTLAVDVNRIEALHKNREFSKFPIFQVFFIL
jgi:hypothetical protein